MQHALERSSWLGVKWLTNRISKQRLQHSDQLNNIKIHKVLSFPVHKLHSHGTQHHLRYFHFATITPPKLGEIKRKLKFIFNRGCSLNVIYVCWATVRNVDMGLIAHWVTFISRKQPLPTRKVLHGDKAACGSTSTQWLRGPGKPAVNFTAADCPSPWLLP